MDKMDAEQTGRFRLNSISYDHFQNQTFFFFCCFHTSGRCLLLLCYLFSRVDCWKGAKFVADCFVKWASSLHCVRKRKYAKLVKLFKSEFPEELRKKKANVVHRFRVNDSPNLLHCHFFIIIIILLDESAQLRTWMFVCI